MTHSEDGVQGAGARRGSRRNRGLRTIIGVRGAFAALARTMGDSDCNITLSSCRLSEEASGKLDAVAGVRLVLSALSVLGTLSIIMSAILKKQVFGSRVFPIFMISIADFLLALLWIGGSILWVARGVFTQTTWCFAASLPTVILECVAINLTLIYAILAYAHIKKRVNSTRVRTYSNLNPDNDGSATYKPAMDMSHHIKTIIAYFTGWVLPLGAVMLSFGILEGQYGIVSETRDCSCWCIPAFGNVMPMVLETPNHATLRFKQHIDSLFLSYGLVVGLHYLIVFPLLLIVYIKILKAIQRLKAQVNVQCYGDEMVERQSLARLRIVSFLTVFLFTGLPNLVASWCLVIKMPSLIHEQKTPQNDWIILNEILILYYVQSFCVPLQGFLNAVVYGWTGTDFISVLHSGSTTNSVTDSFKSAVTEGSVELAKQQSEEEKSEREQYDSSSAVNPMFQTLEVGTSLSDSEQVHHTQI